MAGSTDPAAEREGYARLRLCERGGRGPRKGVAARSVMLRKGGRGWALSTRAPRSSLCLLTDHCPSSTRPTGWSSRQAAPWASFPATSGRAFRRRGEAAAFDLLEALGAARYARGPEKQAQLAGAALARDRLRLLIRMAFDLRCLAPARYEALSRMEREVGRLLGGWRKSAAPPGA